MESQRSSRVDRANRWILTRRALLLVILVGVQQVSLLDMPYEVNAIATYPVAVLTAGDEALGSAFVAYLLSEEGQAMLESYGFQPVK